MAKDCPKKAGIKNVNEAGEIPTFRSFEEQQAKRKAEVQELEATTLEELHRETSEVVAAQSQLEQREPDAGRRLSSPRTRRSDGALS